VTNYRELMFECGRQMGLERRMVPVPFFSPGLSTLWVVLITGASPRLVAPLVKSLEHPMVVRNRALLERSGLRPLGIREALRSCFESRPPTLRKETRQRSRAVRSDPTVRSIQRLPFRSGLESAQALSETYFEWLEQWLSPWVKVVRSERYGRSIRTLRLGFFNRGLDLLVLASSPQVEHPEIASYRVIGGVLAHRLSRGRDAGVFEFRVSESGQYALIGLHDFRPSLPWPLYQWTQAQAHRWVMACFTRMRAAQ
jgi:hypothetical protein